MLKKRYRRDEVSTEWNNGLKNKFNIKTLLDLGVFVLTSILFFAFAKFNKLDSDCIFMFIAIVILPNIVLYFIIRQWFMKVLTKIVSVQTETISATADKVVESANSQKQKFETISSNNKTLSALLDKLKTVSEDTVLMSKKILKDK